MGDIATSFLLSQGNSIGILIGAIILIFLLLQIESISQNRSLLFYSWLVPLTYSAVHLVARSFSIDPFALGFVPTMNRFVFLFVMPSSLIAYGICRWSTKTLSTSVLASYAPVFLLTLAVIPTAVRTWSIRYENSDNSWLRFQHNLQTFSVNKSWNESINIYPLRTTDDAVIPWGKIQVLKKPNSITCSLTGGNYGNRVVTFQK